MALGAVGKFPSAAPCTGAGMGLLADLLNGQHALLYQNAGHLDAGTLASCEDTNDAKRLRADPAGRKLFGDPPRVGEPEEQACTGW